MRAISMKCTQEQFESIKPKLIHELKDDFFNLKEYPYLTNYYNYNYAIGSLDKNMLGVMKVYETWDEKVFLEACGIEVDPKFEITKETVLKYQMKDEFPECFEVKLEVGKWMKTPNNGMYCPKEKKDDGFLCYGFNVNGKWDELFVPNSITKNDVVATTQEIQQALEKEAVKRGFKEGVWFKSAELGGITWCDGYFTFKHGILYSGGNSVFCRGEFATIIPTLTIKEAEEKFNFKIV